METAQNMHNICFPLVKPGFKATQLHPLAQFYLYEP